MEELMPNKPPGYVDGGQHPPPVPNLFAALWAEIEQQGATLIALREGSRPVYAPALIRLCGRLKTDGLYVVAVRKADRALPLIFHGLILCGNPLCLSDPAAVYLLAAAGYPGRFEIAPPGRPGAARPTLRDLLGQPVHTEAGPVFPLVPGLNLGLVFCGVTRDVRHTPVVLIAGTSNAGLLAAATWATDRIALTRVPAPPLFPEYPIEAVVGLATPVGPACMQIGPGAVVLKALVCGEQRYDVMQNKWTGVHTEIVHVVLDPTGSRAMAMYVGRRLVKSVPGNDLFELLRLLAQRSAKGCYTTLDDAATTIDGVPPSRSRHETMKARLADIRKLSRSEDFVKMIPEPQTRRPSYRLNAEIVFRCGPPEIEEEGKPPDSPPIIDDDAAALVPGA
jgi:hypothetical protein